MNKIIKISRMANFSNQIKLKSIGVILLFLLLPYAAWSFDRKTPVVIAVKNVSPAVVNISSEYEVRRQNNPFGANPLFDNFFQDFFEPRIQKRTSLGSGVIIDGKRGYILTNAHVVETRAVIMVTLLDERHYKARIVGVDPDSDLAVLRIDADQSLPSVAMGDSDDIMIGETVIAIGNPFGFSHTVTTGIVSAIDRSIKSSERVFHNFIQTDTSINPGNSGGPLLNINGELIGINTAIYAKAQGIGFAIPINRAKHIITDLIQYGHVIQAWLGFDIQALDARTAQYYKIQPSGGVLIARVESDSPATRAGLEVGDLLLSLNGRKIPSPDIFYSILRSISAGDAVILKIRHENQDRKLQLKSAQFPNARISELAWRRMGIKVRDAKANRGVLITSVRPGSYVNHIGVAPGDLIRQIDENTIENMQDFNETVKKIRMKSSIVILLQRQGQLYYLTVDMD